MIVETTINIFAFFITFPIFATLLVYWLAVKLYRYKLQAIHAVVNWTTALYIIADVMFIDFIFMWEVGGIILIGLIILLAFIIIMQWRRQNEVLFLKAFKLLWRISFLVFLMVYIILVILGMINSILA